MKDKLAVKPSIWVIGGLILISISFLIFVIYEWLFDKSSINQSNFLPLGFLVFCIFMMGMGSFVIGVCLLISNRIEKMFGRIKLCVKRLSKL